MRKPLLKSPAAARCFNPNCTATDYARGLCKRCYQAAFGLVQRGEITWDELMVNGKIRPSRLAIHRAEVSSWLLGAKSN